MKVIVICSGGLDSVTLAWKAHAEHELLKIIAFNYGQRHKKEVFFAEKCARDLGVAFSLIDLCDVGRHLTGSSLTDDIAVPEGHYSEESMKSTIVYNRNPIMLSVAFGIAAALGADAVGMAVHGGDHFIYPDCRPDFVHSFEEMERLALADVAKVTLYAPFVHLSKADIVTIGASLSVPFEESWSCYKGEKLHCGRCGTCVERQEAFSLAGVEDRTFYEDSQFWRKEC